MLKAPHYYHPEVGYNYRMTNIQAAIGCAQMEEIVTLLERKRAIAAAYRAGLDLIPGLTLAPEADWAWSVFWMYSILVEPSFGREREAVREGLRAAGIDSRPFFVPLHELPPYRTADPLPVASRLGAMGLNLPSGTPLTSEQVASVCRALAALRGPS
jgi:perosamine synthetase